MCTNTVEKWKLVDMVYGKGGEDGSSSVIFTYFHPFSPYYRPTHDVIIVPEAFQKCRKTTLTQNWKCFFTCRYIPIHFIHRIVTFPVHSCFFSVSIPLNGAKCSGFCQFASMASTFDTTPSTPHAINTFMSPIFYWFDTMQWMLLMTSQFVHTSHTQ